MIKFPTAALIFLMASTTVPMAGETQPTLNRTPLSQDQLEIYRTFLRSYSGGSKSHRVNVANRTDPLDRTKEKPDRTCLKGIELENEKEAETTFHVFDAKTNISEKVTLVDPDKQNAVIEKNDRQRPTLDIAYASGLLTLSEIAFDRSHKYALMNFSFVCGGLCGQGMTIVFEKVGGRWVRTKRSCGGWIS